MVPRSILIVALLLGALLTGIHPSVADDPGDPSLAPCPDSEAPDSLTSGVAATGSDPSPQAAPDCHYVFQVPSDPTGKQLRFSLATTANHQVFVRKGTADGTQVCQAVGTSTTAQTCTATWPLTAATYHVRVSRVGAAAGNFTLTAFFENAPASGCGNGYGITQLADNVASAAVSITGTTGSRCYFRFTPNSEADFARIATTISTTGTVYVYLKQGDVPIPSALAGVVDADCFHAPGTSGVKSCTAPITEPGATWYGLMYRGTTGTTGSIGIILQGIRPCSLGSGIVPLQAAVPASGTVGAHVANLFCRFRLDPVQVESLSKWTVTNQDANLNLYLRRDAVPTTTTFDCAATQVVVFDSKACSVRLAGATSVYALVNRPTVTETPSAFTLVAEPAEGCSLGPLQTSLEHGVPVSGALTADHDAACRFVFTPDDTAISHVEVPATPGQSFQLLAKVGAEPTPASNDCLSITATGDAVCDLENTGQDIHVVVRRVTGAGPFVVSATAIDPCSLGGGDLALGLGAPLAGALTEDSGGFCRFVFNLPPSQDGVRVTVQPESADYDLYLRKGARPTTTAYDCRAQAAPAGEPETCEVVLDPGTYHVMVRRAGGSGPFTLEATGFSTCSLGSAPVPLAPGGSIAAAVMEVPNAKCYFQVTPGHPLADPAHPANDILKATLGGLEGDLDLYVRNGALPTTTTRDCASAQVGVAAEACEVLVADGSSYFVMVRRASGTGVFSVGATTSSSCSLGAGYHALPNGQTVYAATRRVTGTTACYFVLPSTARDDLATFMANAQTPNTGYTMTLVKDAPFGTATPVCTQVASYIDLLGIVIRTPAQCDLLLEDGLAHQWYVRVSRAATTSQAADVQFDMSGHALRIPVLIPGVSKVGHVEPGQVQYYKVVLPEDATHLSVRTTGDPARIACDVGPDLYATVGTVCLLLPFPMLIGCALLAGYGVSCSQTEKTLYQRCVDEAGPQAPCTELDALRVEACQALNEADPGACDPADTTGSVSATCRAVNKASGTTKCDISGLSAKMTELDLLVRYRTGLPTSSSYSCRSQSAGAVEQCVFDARVKDAHEQTVQPTTTELNGQVQGLRRIVNENRTAADQAIASAKQTVRELRTQSGIDALWSDVRTVLVEEAGKDPGALPSTPDPAAPATPNAVVPDLAGAFALQGPGKYFIAVRGPSALESLFYKGGDFVVTALYDGSYMPSEDDVGDQLPALPSGDGVGGIGAKAPGPVAPIGPAVGRAPGVNPALRP